MVVVLHYLVVVLTKRDEFLPVSKVLVPADVFYIIVDGVHAPFVGKLEILQRFNRSPISA